MDGAPLMSAGLAQNKAYSVMAFKGMATREWWDAIKDEPALLHGIVKTDRLTVFGGGVAITEGETVVARSGCPAAAPKRITKSPRQAPQRWARSGVLP